MFRICLLVAALLWPFGPAMADIPRPLDERATARLIVEAIARVAPDLQTTIGVTNARVSLRLPQKRGMEIDPAQIHAKLRAAPEGRERQKLLDSFVAEQLALLDDLATGKKTRVFDKLSEIEIDTILPVLDLPDPDHPWALPMQPHLPAFGGMMVFWAQDREVAGYRAGPLQWHMLDRFELDKMKLRKIGLANLEARLDRVAMHPDGRFLTLSLGAQFGSSLLLLDSYWQDMAQGGQVLTAAVPRENALIVIADATDTEIAELRSRARAAFAECKNCKDAPLSPDLFRWSGAGWRVLPE